MATTLKKLTGVGGDVRKIAALLKAKAPAGHILAYISPEEAQVLKDRGGSGKPHADTGIPSFELDESFAAGGAEGYGGDTQYQTPVETQAATAPELPFSGAGLTQKTGDLTLSGSPFQGYQTIQRQPTQLSLQATPDVIQTPSLPVSPIYGATTTAPGAGFAGEEAERPGIADQLSKFTGLNKEALARLGLATGFGLYGAGQSRKAAEQGQQASQQMQSLATPYQQAGAQLQAQAQRGELTPAAQQSLQALQAQAAQGAERRGGVGAAQVQQQVEAFRQQLLAQQYDYGIKMSGIGDQIALGAIKSGLQADQYAQQLTNTFANNIARFLVPQAQYPYGYPQPVVS